MLIHSVLDVHPDWPIPVVFDIQEVADWCMPYLTEEEMRIEEDFFNLRAPYDLTWFEFHHPLHRAASVGILQETRESATKDYWICHVQVYLGFRGFLMGAVEGSRFASQKDGHTLVTPPEWEAPILMQTPQKIYSMLPFLMSEKEREISQDRKSIMIIWGMALNFLGCSNIVPRPYTPKLRGLSRTRRKEGKPSPDQFYTLPIEPMKKILREEGQIEKTGLKKALHRCRGHFATYAAEHPLFGKFVGRVFRHDHMRGSAKEGRVFKDYKLRVKEG